MTSGDIGVDGAGQVGVQWCPGLVEEKAEMITLCV
jgi:hypothetical protein